AVLEMQAYLADPPAAAPGFAESFVGSPWVVRLDPAVYRREVRFERPTADADGGTPAPPPVEVTAEPTVGGALRATLDGVDEPGVYTMTRVRLDGAVETTRRAFNVDPTDGDLAKIDPAVLESRLPGVRFHYHPAGTVPTGDDAARFEPRDALLAGFLLLLAAEQLFARRLGR
ncbi:MAG: hypothetical protein ACRDD1_18490, partial [Planctomycetia bacterium]